MAPRPSRDRIVASAIGIGIAFVLGYAWLKIVRAGPVRGHWQSARVQVALPADDALARLGERAARATAASDFRNGGKLVFWRDGKTARSQVQLDGDDRDLAALLRALVAIAHEEPALTFEIASEPPGERFVLAAGGFGKRDQAVQRFLGDYAGARPNLEGVYTSLTLDLPLGPCPQGRVGCDPAEKLRAQMGPALAGTSLAHLRGPLAYEPRPGGVRISARTDGDVRTLLALLAALQTALDRVTNSLAQSPCQLVLDGTRRRELTLATFDDWFALRDELRTGVGPRSNDLQ